MQLTRRFFAAFAAIAILFASPIAATASEDGVRRVALQISDGDPATFTKVLNVAANLARGFSENGEEYEIEIVAFNAGLNILRTDKSPVLERVQNFPQSVPGVTFSACENTIAGMTRKEGSPPPLVDFAQHVSAGVIRLMELDEQGWFVIRP